MGTLIDGGIMTRLVLLVESCHVHSARVDPRSAPARLGDVRHHRDSPQTKPKHHNTRP